MCTLASRMSAARSRLIWYGLRAPPGLKLNIPPQSFCTSRCPECEFRGGIPVEERRRVAEQHSGDGRHRVRDRAEVVAALQRNHHRAARQRAGKSRTRRRSNGVGKKL